MNKSIHENLAKFLTQPSRTILRDFLRENFGEVDHAEFKRGWPELGKIARSLLAIANSGGGAIILGVDEQDDGSLLPIGLPVAHDKADISNGLSKFLPPELKYEVLDFHYAASDYNALAGKLFQVVYIQSDLTELPYICAADGGIGSATQGVVYFRRGTKSVSISPFELKELFRKRVQAEVAVTNVRSLETHLAELKALYNAMPGSITLLTTSLVSNSGPHMLNATLEILVKEKLEKIRRVMN